MKRLKTSSLSFLILSYLSLIFILVFNSELQEIDFPYFFIVWGIGIINAVLNIYYGIKLELKGWILILLVLSGTTWAFLPLLFSYFGIPFMLIYLIIGIYIHARNFTELKTG